MSSVNGPDGRSEVPIRRDHPLAREWAVVIQAPGIASCLAGWEIPEPGGAPPDAERRFEVLWSPEPEVAFAAASIAADLIEPLAPEVAGKLVAGLEEPAVLNAPRAPLRGQAGPSDARLSERRSDAEKVIHPRRRMRIRGRVR